MKMKFAHKVFFSFLLNSLVIVVCMLLFGGYFASRNFEDYVGKMEMERLKQLAEALSQEYRKSGKWDVVLGNWSHWVRWSAGMHGPPPGEGTEGRHPFPSPPPPFSPPMEGNPGMGRPAAPGILPPPPPGHHPDPPRIMLFDAEKNPLTQKGSASADDCRLKPIMADGHPVGWVGLKRVERPSHPLDVEFIKQQSQMFYSTGAVALILAVLVTYVLSRHVLAPVRKLAEGTRALSSRRFETRIEGPYRDELGQLAADFNTMAQALERYEQMRRQWIADISHELRTPLAILRGEIEALLDGMREVTRGALESLQFEVLHLARIVHDLRELTLIESRAVDMELTVVNPFDVLEETLKSFQPRFQNLGIGIEGNNQHPGRVSIMADADRLRQLFSNVLENTLRYADAPGVLRISSELKKERLFLHFDDSGPGVPEDSLGRLFDRLYRVDRARSRTHGGSGLGLAICRGIVERFGGRIEAQHAPSGGLRITMVLPVLG